MATMEKIQPAGRRNHLWMSYHATLKPCPRLQVTVEQTNPNPNETQQVPKNASARPQVLEMPEKNVSAWSIDTFMHGGASEGRAAKREAQKTGPANGATMRMPMPYCPLCH